MPAVMASPSRIEVAHIVETAIRAPSSHNTQPWHFRLNDASIDLLADEDRALPVNDPDGRELTISCGAALFHLRLAVRQAGFDPRVLPFPDPEDPAIVARVEFRRPYRSDPLVDTLFAAVDRRHTTRGPFLDEPLDGRLVQEIGTVVGREGAWWSVVPRGGARELLASLVNEGDRHQFADAAWRRELASWIHPRGHRDGLPVPPGIAPVARLLISHLDLGSRIGRQDETLVANAPCVLVLGTRHDAPIDWLQAGQALAAALLTAARVGVQAGFANQPCQVAALRWRLAALVEEPGHPQVVLRLGRPAATVHGAPRRPVDAVLS
jgi:nitroreductase